jgi:hypothetical protein
MWTAVAPAEAAKRPRRYSSEVLEGWCICRNGAELTISSGSPRVKLVVRSATSGRTLARFPVRLRYHPHNIWEFNDVPTPPVVVIDDPDTDPRADDNVAGNEVRPENQVDVMLDEESFPAILADEDQRRDYVKTVKVLWRPLAGRLVDIGLGPNHSEITFGRFEVGNCLQLSGKGYNSFAPLASWLRNPIGFA